MADIRAALNAMCLACDSTRGVSKGKLVEPNFAGSSTDLLIGIFIPDTNGCLNFALLWQISVRVFVESTRLESHRAASYVETEGSSAAFVIQGRSDIGELS